MPAAWLWINSIRKSRQDAAVWERVVRKVRTGMMPPSGQPRPSRAALDGFAAELETRLDKAAAANPNMGSLSLHRLNRTEYANVIRDLLAIDVDVSTMLPSDDSNEGFDNIADALGVSPTLIQGYVLRRYENQPARRRRSHADTHTDDIHCAKWPGSGLAFRRSAAWNSRWHADSLHVSARCGISIYCRWRWRSGRSTWRWRRRRYYH